MIGALVTIGQTPYNPITNPGAIDPLDIIRNDSNIILKLDTSLDIIYLLLIYFFIY